MTLRERWEAFSQRERYLLMAAGVCAVVVLVYYSPLSALGTLSSQGGDDRWMQVRKIESYQKILARTKAAEQRRDRLEARYEAAQQRLIKGATPTQVGAELQGRISSMAADSGLQVLSSQILKVEEYKEFHRVGVRLTLSGKLAGLSDLLSAIETGPSDLAVTLLEINRKLGASRRPTPARTSATGVSAPLTATMEIKTIMQEAL